jgi:FkbH-like protein
MNFLEATRLVRDFVGGPALPYVLALSGSGESLELYLKAAAASKGRKSAHRLLPFNTLQQHALTPAEPGLAEVFVLLPWDLIPELDWRSGITLGTIEEEALRQRAQQFLARLQARNATLLYIPADTAPLWLDPGRNTALNLWLHSLALAHGAHVQSPQVFALGPYLANGCAIASTQLPAIAQAVVDALLVPQRSSAKVLVTDLDFTLWSGIIGDDGPAGIAYRAEGKGYQHFIYQTFLKRLQQDGVLIAAVSKNDHSVAAAPLDSGDMVIQRADLVALLASWNAKSAQIQSLAEQLNLGLDAFVFVDDNPVELAEVAQHLPSVHCVLFPDSERGLPALLEQLTGLFARTTITTEDRERTALYQRRLQSLVPSEASGADIGAFLRELNMTLEIHDRSQGDRTRAVQLINKTNQFNINGLRITDEEVAARLASGDRLYTATLTDRAGSHGEVLAALIDAQGLLQALVMSCRVFQRRVEFAFLSWLADQPAGLKGLAYQATERNEPVRRLLEDLLGHTPESRLIRFEGSKVADRCRAERVYFNAIDDGVNL